MMAAKSHQPLPVVKMRFDCTVSIIALILSLVYFRQFHGIREGTIIAAFGVGRILSLYEPLSRPCIAFCAARKRCNPAPTKKRRALFPKPLRCPCAAHEPMGGAACRKSGFYHFCEEVNSANQRSSEFVRN